MMLIYSWQLAIVVWVCVRAAVPVAALLPAQALRRLRHGPAPGRHHALGDLRAGRRRRGGPLLRRRGPHPGAASTTRSRRYKAASTRAQGFTAFSFSLGGVSAGLANAGVLDRRRLARLRRRHHRRQGARVRVPGHAVRRAGADGHPDPHRRPERHRRLAPGHRHPRDPRRPRRPRRRRRGRCRGARSTSASSDVDFAYPGGPPVLRDVDLDIAAGTRVAIVGETGSGKSTFAKLLTRLMDPLAGRGAARRRRRDARSRRPRCGAAWCWCRRRASSSTTPCAANVRYGRLDATEADILRQRRRARPRRLAGRACRAGSTTRVGQRGESLSAGERQLVALLRAHLADPDLLVLDEATSAVDPALEMRIGRGARAADERPHLGHHRAPAVDRRERRRGRRRRQGPVVQRGPHRELVAAGRRRLRRAARLLGRPAGPAAEHRSGWPGSRAGHRSTGNDGCPPLAGGDRAPGILGA